MVSIHPKITREEQDLLRGVSKDLRARIRKEAKLAKQELGDRNVVRYHIDHKADLQKLQKLESQNQNLLAFGVLLIPLILPSIIMLALYMNNQNQAAELENKILEKRDYHGFYLKEMKGENFEQPLADTLELGKQQIAKDINRGLMLEHLDLREVIQEIFSDEELGFLVNYLEDFPDNPVTLKRIKEELIRLHNDSNDPLIDIILSGENIANFTSPTQLLEDALKPEKIDALMGYFFPALNEEQRKILMRGHHQSMMSACQGLIDLQMLLSHNVMLTQDYVTDIYFDEKDQKVHYRVSKNDIVLETIPDKQALKLPGSLSLEYVLEDNGFVLKDVEISDKRLADLVFAKDSDDVLKAFGAYGIVKQES